MSDNRALITELQRIGERALSGNLQDLLNRAAEAIIQGERQRVAAIVESRAAYDRGYRDGMGPA